MQPYVKLKIPNNISSTQHHNVYVSYGKGYIDFSHIPAEIEKELLSIIPDEFRKYYNGSFMNISNSYICPHTDSDRKVAINFYIKTGGATTLFWNKKSGIENSTKVAGQTNGFTYRECDLNLCGFFRAQPNDIYILDVTQIHSVINNLKKDRIAYTLASNILSYTQTVEILQHLI